MTQVASRLRQVLEELPPRVTLVDVSKFQPIQAVLEAYGAGQRVFGENRPQELALKAAQAPSDIRWHMIGHLQTNKVKLVVPCASMIESVDSMRLLQAVNDCSARLGKVMDILLEVHIAADEAKQGFSPDEIPGVVSALPGFPSVRLCGLMGMASLTDDANRVRGEFRSLRLLFESVAASLAPEAASAFQVLSMGMSGDWPLAVAEGATHVRIGTRIFGVRH